MQLRPYQQKLHDEIEAAWTTGHRVVMAQLPTGGGKTVTFSHLVHEEAGASVVMAHRRELIAQMSLALGREGVRHRVFGPPALSTLCTWQHMRELNANYVNPAAQTAVASVQTLAAMKTAPAYFDQVRLWVGDEGHHYIRGGQFGQAVDLFPNARGLLVTATPGRADGKGLGRHADGFADVLIRGPHPCDLIAAGYLSPYKIYAPPSNLDREHIPVTASGDFNQMALRDFTKKSTVLGDVAEHYCRHTRGQLGLTFADSIENATTICGNFRAQGVPAEVLTGKTPDDLRARVLEQFRNRQVHQIVSVALIDEGFDCPAVEVVSDAAATESFNRFAQRFGRGLRVMEGKPFMTYFDHVGNVIRHGLPDAPRVWSLDRRERSSRGGPTDVVPVRSCPKCTAVYERIHRTCPYCGHYAEPAGRSAPELVDGDLQELTADALARMRGEVAKVDWNYVPIPDGATPIIARAIQGRHHELQRAQAGLRQAMALWGGWRTAAGEDVATAQRRFYLAQGIDVMSAQALRAREAVELTERINGALRREGVVNG